MQRRSREAWQQLVEEWRASGKNAARWCRENQISYQSFCNWRKKEAENSNQFVELSDQKEILQSGIGLSCGGLVLQISSHFDEDALLRFLAVLKKLPC